jgi:hypothetical protein
MTKPLRLTMPCTAEFLDALREEPFFDRTQINAAIRAGIDGQPVFWAKEGGHEIGTPSPIDPERNVPVSLMLLGPNKKPVQEAQA